MKVIYKKVVTDQIKEAISSAAVTNKEIQRIELSTKEFDNLLQEDADNTGSLWNIPSPPLSYFTRMYNGTRSVHYLGVTIQEVKGVE